MVKGKGKKSTSKKEQKDHYDTWLDFSREISERINDITKESTSEYKDLYKMWSEYAQKMTEQMAKSSPEDGIAFEDMQKVWTAYSDKLGETFVDHMNKENGPYKELYHLWTEYSGKMGDHLSELMSESIKEQTDLYEIWMDAFGMKDNDQEEGLPGVYKGMNQFWLEMWEKSKDMFPSKPTGDMDLNANFKELNDVWTKNYSKMIMNIVRSPDFAKMDGNILNGNLDIKRINDQYMGQYLSAMGLPTKENLNDIYLKLHDMDKKISEISRVINSKNTTSKR